MSTLSATCHPETTSMSTNQKGQYWLYKLGSIAKELKTKQNCTIEESEISNFCPIVKLYRGDKSFLCNFLISPIVQTYSHDRKAKETPFSYVGTESCGQKTLTQTPCACNPFKEPFIVLQWFKYQDMSGNCSGC